MDIKKYAKPAATKTFATGEQLLLEEIAFIHIPHQQVSILSG